MAYDSALLLNRNVFAAKARVASFPDRRDEFRRLERLMVLMGGAAAGAIIGFAAAMTLGRLELWMVILTAAPLLVLALYLTGETAREAMSRKAYGCTAASCLHVAALLAWPLTSLLTPLGSLNFWIAPVLAVGTLVLFASCWSGPSRAVYRLGAQGLLIGALAAHQGTLLILGN